MFFSSSRCGDFCLLGSRKQEGKTAPTTHPSTDQSQNGWSYVVSHIKASPAGSFMVLCGFSPSLVPCCQYRCGPCTRSIITDGRLCLTLGFSIYVLGQGTESWLSLTLGSYLNPFLVRASGQKWCPENHKEPNRRAQRSGMIGRGQALVTLEPWEGTYYLSVSCPIPGPGMQEVLVAWLYG